MRGRDWRVGCRVGGFEPAAPAIEGVLAGFGLAREIGDEPLLAALVAF